MVDGKETAQEIYGEGAILSNTEGQTIEIQTSGTTKFESAIDIQPTEGNPTEEQTPEGKAEGTPEEKPTGEPSVETQVKSQIEAGKALEADLTSKGVDFKALETEYVTTGLISTESREILAKAGYPSQVVDAYINGMQATAEKFENSVYNLVGGRDQFIELSNHIKTQGNASISAFNTAVDTGNITQIGMILRGVKADLESSRGTNNFQILGNTGGGKPTGQAQGYTSKAEMVKAMSDNRYGKDRGYTKQVEAKVLNSNF